MIAEGRPSASERTALSGSRTGASAMVVALVLMAKIGLDGTHLGLMTVLGMALACSLGCMWSQRRGYRQRGLVPTRVPPPREALAAAVSVALSSVAGLIMAIA